MSDHNSKDLDLSQCLKNWVRQIVTETLQEAVATVSHEAEIVSHEETLHHAGNHEPELCEIPDPTANGILLSTICEEAVQPQETYYSMEDVSMGPILPLTLEELVIEDGAQQDTQGLPQVDAQEGLPQEISVLSDSDIRDSELKSDKSDSDINISAVICDNTAPQATGTLPAEPVMSQVDPIGAVDMALPVNTLGGARPKERVNSDQVINNTLGETRPIVYSDQINNNSAQGSINIVHEANCAVLSTEFTPRQENEVNGLLEWTENIGIDPNWPEGLVSGRTVRVTWQVTLMFLWRVNYL